MSKIPRKKTRPARLRNFPGPKIGIDPRTIQRTRRSFQRVNASDYHSLFTALNSAADILHRNRTPDPRFIAAFDTLKQARAMLEKALSQPQETSSSAQAELAA